MGKQAPILKSSMSQFYSRPNSKLDTCRAHTESAIRRLHVHVLGTEVNQVSASADVSRAHKLTLNMDAHFDPLITPSSSTDCDPRSIAQSLGTPQTPGCQPQPWP